MRTFHGSFSANCSRKHFPKLHSLLWALSTAVLFDIRISSGLPDREITSQRPWLENLILHWKFRINLVK